MSDNGVITLPRWMTRRFCRYWLDPKGPGERPVTGAQRKRYKAIAAGVDWNAKRGYRLVWEKNDDN